MIIDSSVVLAILFEEEDFLNYRQILDDAPSRFMSAPSLVEASVVYLRRTGAEESSRLDRLIAALLIEIVEFDHRHAALAQGAFAHYGKGRHPAQLNFGDCFTYALAKSFGQPLLFKGEDFSHTDLLLA